MTSRGGSMPKRQFKPNLAAAGKKEAKLESASLPASSRGHRGGGGRSRAGRGAGGRGRGAGRGGREVVVQDGGVFYGQGPGGSGGGVGGAVSSSSSWTKEEPVVFTVPSLTRSDVPRVRARGWSKRASYGGLLGRSSGSAGAVASRLGPAPAGEGEEDTPVEVKRELLIDDETADKHALVNLLQDDFVSDLKKGLPHMKPIDLTNREVFAEALTTAKQEKKQIGGARARIESSSDEEGDATTAEPSKEASGPESIADRLRRCQVKDLAAAPPGLVFFQLPNVLSEFARLVKADPTATPSTSRNDSMEVDVIGGTPKKVTSSAVSRQPAPAGNDNEAEGEDDPTTRHCLGAFADGVVGKLQIMKSGKTRLRIGNQYLDVALGSEIDSLQEMVKVRTTKDEADVEKVTGGEMNVIGQVRHRLVCTYNVDGMLEECQKR